MKQVKCSNPTCSDRRPHYERPDEKRPHQTLEVPDDYEGFAYCSIECKCYHEAKIQDRLNPCPECGGIADDTREYDTHCLNRACKLYSRSFRKDRWNALQSDFDMDLEVSAYMDAEATFVTEVHGKVTVGVLQEIQDQLAAWALMEKDRRREEVRFKVTRYSGGYWQCEEIQG